MKFSIKVLKAIFLCMFFMPMTNLFPENANQDLNLYYKFPFSLALEYQSYSYYGENKSSNDIVGLVLNARLPLHFFPSLQPSLELGFINIDNLDPLAGQTWDHSQYYALLGMVYANHFNKIFEYGIELSGGAGYLLFPNLQKNSNLFYSVNLAAQAGLYIGLVPNYNFMISAQPYIKYYHSLTSLKNFDGVVLGWGLSLHYRFGDDPEQPKTQLNSLDFGDAVLPPVYANMQHYYTNHALGKLTITNTENYPVKNIEVYFAQKTYLDSKSFCGSKGELEPGQSWDVELYATFNNQIFDIEGSVPVNGEIIVTYKALGRTGEQRKSVSFELNDKTTITWNDYHKVAALITPSDSALKNYSSFIQHTCEGGILKDLNHNLQWAMQLYAGLTELDITYQPDPILPFNVIKQGEQVRKDTVYLARDTLKRGNGDCDDLTVLYCSLLESIGIETGYIIIPGHIIPVFNTKLPARSFRELDPEKDMSIQYNNELWIPVEITLLGNADFLAAWKKGIELYKSHIEERSFYITSEAQEIYQPVGLKEKDLGLQYGDSKQIKHTFQTYLEDLAERVCTGYRQKLQKEEDEQAYNSLGNAYAAFGKFEEAEKAFKKALKLKGDYLYAKVNLGVLSMRKKEYGQALNWLEESAREFSLTPAYPQFILFQIYQSISRCYSALKEDDKANEFQRLAYELNKTGSLLAEKKTNLDAEGNSLAGFIWETK